jgi:DNA-binding PadR family transcriptional regulator
MLNKLETKGFVKSRKELKKGRARKIYEITERGKEILHAYNDSLREQLPQEKSTGRQKRK